MGFYIISIGAGLVLKVSIIDLSGIQSGGGSQFKAREGPSEVLKHDCYISLSKFAACVAFSSLSFSTSAS